ncbi:MAG: cbb3-type cytochrome c oxidase subunit I [Bryobacterales bacterium]|nr:cbb3-type cytochrome c oxidase subunit I [Bryobacterales bacterium]
MTEVQPSKEVAEYTEVHRHPEPKSFLWKYIFSVDHKVIGIQYLLLAVVAVFVGMALSLLVRLRLVCPECSYPLLGQFFPVGAPEGVMTPEFYLAMLTMHGTVMVFMVLTTAPQGGFGNYFLPIQIGAADMAFPRLNMLSFWTTFVSFLLLMAAFVVEGGAPMSGWTAYPPLSALPEATVQGIGQDLWLASIAVFCIASLLGALNFIVTTLDLRAKGLTMMRLPLTCWTWFVTAILGLLAFGVLLAAGVLLLMDRNVGTSFFVPAGLVVSDKVIDHSGGSPILWQHLFWFFGHPEVYIAILPGMGVTSHVLSTFARKTVFGYKAMVYAIAAIGGLGFVVWGHHMFVSGMSPYSAFVFSVLTMCIGVPSAIKTFNWIGTMWGGKIRFASPMLFSIGFVSLFVSGGISGIFLGQPTIDLYFHDTYFVVAHFHLIMGVAAIFGMFAGITFWFPKIFGRMMNEPLNKIHFWLTFVGVYAIFGPMHYLGMLPHPRRYAEITSVDYLGATGAAELHMFITVAAVLTVLAQFLFLYNFVKSIFSGKECREENPWEATTLEWAIPSPPPHDNFGGKVPHVYRGAYDFSLRGAKRDFAMQCNDDKAVFGEPSPQTSGD